MNATSSIFPSPSANMADRGRTDSVTAPPSLTETSVSTSRIGARWGMRRSAAIGSVMGLQIDAAVHRKNLPGDVGGLSRCETADHPGDFVRPINPALAAE